MILILSPTKKNGCWRLGPFKKTVSLHGCRNNFFVYYVLLVILEPFYLSDISVGRIVVLDKDIPRTSDFTLYFKEI